MFFHCQSSGFLLFTFSQRMWHSDETASKLQNTLSKSGYPHFTILNKLYFFVLAFKFGAVYVTNYTVSYLFAIEIHYWHKIFIIICLSAYCIHIVTHLIPWYAYQLFITLHAPCIFWWQVQQIIYSNAYATCMYSNCKFHNLWLAISSHVSHT